MSMLYGPLIRKLEAFEPLNGPEKQAVISLCDNVHQVSRRRHIISEGVVPSCTHVILSGWAARYKLVPSGKRRITAILLPGDFCDIHATALATMDHNILAITDCQVAQVAPRKIHEITRSTPALTRALWRSTLVDEAILRQWLVNGGRKDALQTIAHLFCELRRRLQLTGVATDNRFELPLTQEEMGDATGLTAVHVNRTLVRLRDNGLVTLVGGVLDILDVHGLERACGFDPSYLHLPIAGLSGRSDTTIER
jgi:CRP-like cAMP-binding protein